MHTNATKKVGQFRGSWSFCPWLAARKNKVWRQASQRFSHHEQQSDSADEPSTSAGCRRKKWSRGLFLPSAGNRWNDELNNAGDWGNYWSSSLNESNENNAYNLNFNSGNANWNNNNRNNGQSVRPVRSTYHCSCLIL